jgi:hypothetical protein
VYPMLPASLGCHCCVLVHWVHKKKTKTNKTKQGQLQRNRQHWVHKTKDNQNKTKTQQEQPIETGNIGYVPNVACFSGLSLLCSCYVCLCLLSCVPSVACFSGLSLLCSCYVCLCLLSYNDNPEKQATLGTQDKRRTKQNKNTTRTTTEKQATLGTQDKRQTKQNFLFCFVCLLSCVPSVACFSVVVLVVFLFCFVRLLSCVPNVACFSRLFLLCSCFV